MQHNACAAGGVSEFTNSEQLMYVAVRLWTSAEQLGGRELCSILNEAIRTDAEATVAHAAMVTQARRSVHPRGGESASLPTRSRQVASAWPAPCTDMGMGMGHGHG